MFSSTLSLTSALYVAGGQGHAWAALYPRERPGTHCIGGWVAPRTVVDRCGKSPDRPAVARRYTDYAILCPQHLYLS